MKVKCQYTGFEFEADSKRSKNHPLVSKFLNQANEDGKRLIGSYAAAKGILSEAAQMNFDSIESLMEAAEVAYENWKSSDAQKKMSHSAILAQRLAEQRKRRELLRGLKSETAEEMDFAGASASEEAAPLGTMNFMEESNNL
jgi:hypothetical protein